MSERHNSESSTSETEMTAGSSTNLKSKKVLHSNKKTVLTENQHRTMKQYSEGKEIKSFDSKINVERHRARDSEEEISEIDDKNSDLSTTESEVSACSSNFNPIKALYSKKSKIPVEDAPVFENLEQLMSSFKNDSVLPVGYGSIVKEREEKKLKLKLEEEKLLEEKNRARFAQYRDLMPTKKIRRKKNVLTKMENVKGPLGALKECVDGRLRIKVTTRNEKGIRGLLHATLVAFDKQWNLALSDVVEEWTRKSPNKRKIPPAVGRPVPKGTASTISTVPKVIENPLGKGMWQCTRYLPQLLVRGEHVVIINIVER
ncbi:U7 snRNA-associated Sm-like protein LSm11 [Bombyx mandarina]|uniref:U7 snRNA-associated Sm-like protein LSm11 n=1 Tax=Bombyx mandarina TaxID=7092 RepID=A0A6J2JJ66_BOMMA|nr:U7 snRNA-associated Sm-like protein LSm11 [Bombyx mandarina]